MKAKLRKEQRERMKTSTSNKQNNNSDNKSIESNQPETKKKKGRYRSAEIPNGIFPEENIQDSSINSKAENPFLNPNELNQINKEEIREQELSKIATMFNFEVDKEKEIIKIKENDEYYDMRKQIKELEIELEKTKQEYEDVLQQNKRDTENQKEQIEELENELKRQVEFDIEKVKKENIVLVRDINILDKKLESITALYKKEQYDMNATINELDNTIRKLKGEIFFVEDLKLRLKNLKNKDIPQELANSINLNFNIKEDNEDVKDLTDTSKFGMVKSKTGSIPITDILDFSSFDSKKSVKKLYV